ncbi:MAG: carboxyl transferase [Proteobacteria bacterium]|nr:carboxyl transferase [Pseudomonadota bacterium]
MPFERELEELARRKQAALEMGGREKVERQHQAGRLTARERIGKLLDPGSFLEIGLLNCSDVPGMEDRSPTDSKICGYGEIDRRQVVVSANDFTVLSATSSRVAGKKEGEAKRVAEDWGYPLVYLAEAGGARMPDIMGSIGLASFGGGGFDTFLQRYSRVRRAPMVTAIMGQSWGMPTWMGCLADFVVQIKGSAWGVSGPRVVSLALSESVTEEELGGWKVHAEMTGMTDAVAETEDECFDLIRMYLGYMPAHCDELPPEAEVPEGSGLKMADILNRLPEKRNRAYDMHRLLRCIVDEDSLFPLKGRFGRSVITALARVAGRVIGIVANQPLEQGGAMDTDGIDKVTSFLCLCDSFNVPLVFFHDIPGFMVGKPAERKRVAAKVINYVNALALVSVPKISIIVRKTYGMAYWNMCGSGAGPDFHVAWPSAEMSFVDPEIAAQVVYGGKGLDEEQLKAKTREMIENASPYGAAGRHYIQDVIDPRETRDYIAHALKISQGSRSRGIGRHELANWPTKF